jgi:hypothetical protein
MSTSKPLASDFADYWYSAERYLEYFLGSNNLRNEAGELDFEGYHVETATAGYSRPKYEIYAEPQPEPQQQPQAGA